MKTAANFEDILHWVGGQDRWQWTVFLFGTLTGFFNAMHNLGSAFLASTPDHWCSVPGLDDGWSDNPDMKAFVLPREERNGKSVFSRCLYYDRDYASLNETTFIMTNASETLPNSTTCDQWLFDASDQRNTVVTEWSLVCSYQGLSATVQASYMMGILLGSIIISAIADRFGRRVAFLISLTEFLVSSIAAAFATNYMAFISFRVFIAMGLCGCYVTPYIIVTEITGSTKLRSFFGIIFNIPFALGYMVLPGIAYVFREWSSLQLAISIPGASMIILYWFIPESPRWLMNKGRYDEALAILQKGAAINKRTLPPVEEILSTMKFIKKKEEASTERNQTGRRKWLIVELCRHRKIRNLTCIVYFTWFTVSMVYYGLALNSPQMSSDRYLVFFVAGAVEIPAYIIAFAALQVIGRKKSYCFTFLIGGVACLAVYFVPDTDVTWLRDTLAVLGKFSITATFAISYLYTAELFPTEIRTMAVGYGSTCARIGSISAPYILQLLGSYHEAIPLVVFGVLSVASSALSLLLPETSKSGLTESIAGYETESSHLSECGKLNEEDPAEAKFDTS